MKKILYTFLLISPLLFISSCDKDVEEVETYSLIGLWNGISHLEVENEGYIDSITGLDVITEPYSYLNTFNSSSDSIVIEFSSDTMGIYYYDYYEEYGEMIFEADTEYNAYSRLGNEIILMSSNDSDSLSITSINNNTLELFQQSRHEWEQWLPWEQGLGGDTISYFRILEDHLVFSRIE